MYTQSIIYRNNLCYGLIYILKNCEQSVVIDNVESVPHNTDIGIPHYF